MKVQVHGDKLGAVQVMDNLSAIIIWDDAGNPIQVVKKLGPGVLLSYKGTDLEFKKALKSLGVEDTTRFQEAKQ